MSSNVFRKAIFRKAVAALLVSTALTLAGAAPAHASRFRPHRAVENPVRNDSPRGLFASLLIYLLDCAGGAMDPNGSH
jgi:hypothetical protein